MRALASLGSTRAGSRRTLTRLVLPSALVFALSLLIAAPASAQGPDTGTGSAFGISATGPLTLVNPTPLVTLGPDGQGNSLSGIYLNAPPIITGGIANAATGSTFFGTGNENVVSTAGLVDVNLLGLGSLGLPPSLGLSLSLISLHVADVTCDSNANGSSGSVTHLALTIGGSPINLPNPIPANYILGGGSLGPLAGLLLVTLNAENGLNTAHSTTISVTAISITLLGVVDHGETINIAQANCSVSGPDIHPINSVVPESPAAIMLPIAGGLAAVAAVGGTFAIRRRRLAGVSNLED